MAKRLPADVLAALQSEKYLRIRAGAAHRFIHIWVVLVGDRAFVRSWSIKPRSWYRTFLEDPRGAIEIDGRVIEIRAARSRGERLKDKVSQAYLDKYTTKANLPWARGMDRKKSRETTTELLPV